MAGLNLTQSEAVREVMARYEGFMKWLASTSQCQPAPSYVQNRAQKLLDDCREIMREAKAE